MNDFEQTDYVEPSEAQILETLDLCLSYLPNDIQPSHRQRLAYIREWVASRQSHDSELARHPQRLTKKYLFEWIEQDANTYVSDSPYGKVIICEERPKKPFSYGASSTYKTWIEDSTGARYNCLEKFIDFVDAENWLQDALNRLDDPRISEWFLEGIHFTLAICERALPRELQPVHCERIEFLEMLLDDFLL